MEKSNSSDKSYLHLPKLTKEQLDGTSDTRLTRDNILKRISEEEIFNKYLGFPPTNKLVKNPLREDKKASCNFYWNGIKYKFKDRPRNIDEDCFGIVMLKFKCNFYEALQRIAIDFGIANNFDNSFSLSKRTTQVEVFDNVLVKSLDRSEIDGTVREFYKNDYDFWMQFNIDKEILKLGNVRCLEYYFINKELMYRHKQSDPCYAYTFEDRTVKLYFPRRSKEQVRFITNCPASILQGWNILPEEQADILFITKSYKDVLSLRSFGIYSVAPQSESSFMSYEQLEYLKSKFKEIYLYYDNDNTGISYMQKFSKQYDIPYVQNPEGYSKDFSDFVKDYGADSVYDLIETIINNQSYG